MQQPETIDLPASPVAVDPAIRDAASNVIGAEQWLERHGWRKGLHLMTLAKGDQFLEGYKLFVARLAIEHRRVRRGQLLWWLPVTAIAGLSGLAIGFMLCGLL